VGSIPASNHGGRARILYLWWYASPGAAADQPGVQDWYIPFIAASGLSQLAVPSVCQSSEMNGAGRLIRAKILSTPDGPIFTTLFLANAHIAPTGVGICLTFGLFVSIPFPPPQPLLLQRKNFVESGESFNFGLSKKLSTARSSGTHLDRIEVQVAKFRELQSAS
jgi:hypothetical protein